MINNLELINMVSENRIRELLAVLSDAYPKSLMVKEIAEKVGTSPNTTGKYVDILEARGLVTVKPYATARQVVLKAPPTGFNILPDQKPEGSEGLESWMALNDFELETDRFDIRDFLKEGVDVKAFFTYSYEDLKSKIGGKIASIKWEIEQLQHINLEAYSKTKKDLLKKGVNIIRHDNEIYPKSLKKSERFYPLVLYQEGALLNFDNCVAITGTRDPTPFAQEKIRKLSQSLARGGYTIVSGLALGTDTEAHIGALDVDGKTIAVIPNIGKITPGSNLHLAEHIMRQGAILSTGSPLSLLTKDKWAKRNKVISGLSKCLCTVVSPKSKGTYYQVDFALNQGIKVFALEPPRDDDLEYFAFKKLLDMGATPFESESEILNYLKNFPGVPRQTQLLTSSKTSA